jgi:peptide deformylase
MILTALEPDDPRLRQVCAPVTRSDLRLKAQQIEIEALLDYVYGRANKKDVSADFDRGRPNTVGLSANQVGIMKCISIVDLAIGHRGFSDMHVLINPRIVWRSKAVVRKREGCVNMPRVWGETVRSKSVKVEAIDRSGNEVTVKAEGWPAVLLQHELDHLGGHLFIDRLPDPTQAHLVEAEEFATYRRMRPERWEKFIDMSAWVVK